MEAFEKRISHIFAEKRFDVQFYEKATELDKYSKDNLQPLNTVLEYLKEKRDPTLSPDKEFIYADIQSVDVNDGTIQAEVLLGEEAPSRARMVIHEGDIIISTCRPTRKAIAKILKELDGQIASTGFCITRPKSEYNPDFVFHILRSEEVAKQLGRFSSGTSYPAVLGKHIKRVKVPIPSPDIQNKIAKIMQTAYVQRKKLLTKVNDYLKSTDAYAFKVLNLSEVQFNPPKVYFVNIQDMLGDRFDGLFYTPSPTAILDSNQWCYFEQYAAVEKKTFTPSNTPSTIYYYLEITQMENNSFITDDFATEATGEEINGLRQKASSGDILLARLGPCIANKKSALVSETKKPICCSTEYLVIRPKKGVDVRFLFWCIKSDFLLKQMETKVRGATPSRFRLYQEDLLKLRVPIANDEQQQKIGEEIERRRLDIIHLRQEADQIVTEAKAQVEKLLLGD